MAKKVTTRKKAATPATKSAATKSAYTRPPSRENKIAITAWLSPEYMRSFRLIQAKDANPNRTLQDMIGEAFNEFFKKHGVPIVEG